jgi:TRAP-type mannitol/chloroaromatic compound transport system permease small subunit
LTGLGVVEGHMTLLSRLDRTIGILIAAAQWLALPLIVLLFLQWPLRDLVRCCSREANDLGQVIFAVYVALSISAATRAGTHLAADTLAQRYSPRTRRRLKQFGATIAILPWALFILYAGKTIVMSSVLGLEAFPDTNNPGYFIIKAALWIMAIVVVAQAVAELFRAPPSGDG